MAIGITIVTCDMGVPPLFMKNSNATSAQCYAYHAYELVPVLILQSLYVFKSKIFSNSL